MSLNVLVVDDSRVMRRMILRTLGIAGLPIEEALEAGSAEQGWELLERGDVGLALLDINLPGMSGIELLEKMRGSASWQDTPVVVISTEGSEPRRRAVERHRAGFVRKPFTPEALARAGVEAGGAAP